MKNHALSAGTSRVAMPAIIDRRRAPSAIARDYVRANVDPNRLLQEISAAFDDFKEKQGKRLTDVEAALDQFAVLAAAREMAGGGASNGSLPVDRDYTDAMASYIRHGGDENQLRAKNKSPELVQIRAALMSTSSADGGYLAPIEWDRTVRKKLLTLSPMRRISRVELTQHRGYTSVWNSGGWSSGWVGETAPRPNTSTPQLAEVKYVPGELYAMPAITQGLLEDADFNIEAWLTNEVSFEFSRQEGVAFLSGDGVNKPQGLLTYTDTANPLHPGGALQVVPSGAAATIADQDKLVDFVYNLPSPYRRNATWLMNSTTAATIAKMKNGQGDYIWRQGLTDGEPSTLLGYPVAIDENMPAIAAGALPIAFGDFAQGYVVNDRVGTMLLRDPYANKPYVNFYVRKRVGGGVSDPNAIQLMRIAAN